MAPSSSPLALKRKSQCHEISSSSPLRSTKTPPMKTPDKTITTTVSNSQSPEIRNKILDETITITVPNDQAPEKPKPTIRERRGRRNITNSSFRPLSVFTRSLLLPFDFDIEKGFEILKGDSPNRLEEARRAVSSSHKRLKVKEEKEDEQMSTQSCKDVLPIALVKNMSDPFECRQDTEMDLMTALKVTFPDKDVPRSICADFAMLCELPAPQYSQHPAYSTDPFKATSEAPFLSTLTKMSEIKSHNPKNRIPVENETRSRQDSLERKRSFFGLELRTPASVRSRNAFSTPEEVQPSSTLSTSSTISSPPKSSSLPAASEFLLPKPSTGTNSSSSIRKFSDRFRSRANSEQNDLVWNQWSPKSPRLSGESPNLNRQDLERYVRRTTNTPTYDYNPTSPYPRHPHTGRGWKSRNLKCTTCVEQSCACCGRACCAFRAAVLALDTHPEGTSGRTVALHRIQEITKLYPYGQEVPTFLQCTAGLIGDGMGCGKLVCPDCCSICPDEACGDTQCRKCKSGMWEECTWHRGISFV